MKITPTLFGKIQREFYLNVISSPICCKLTIESSVKVALSYESFIGESVRESISYDIRCLYNRTLDNHTRQKFGLSEDVSSTLYLSPILLQEIVGNWELDARKLSVNLLGEEYLVQRVQKIGYIPHFNACLAVELRLIDNIKAGT
jgi:hypothetical protein